MLSHRRLSAPRRALMAAAGGFGIFGAGTLFAPCAHAAAPRYPDILPLSHVHAGMTGYGLTTFKGTTISRFEVTVIGILKKENAGHDLILIRMKGGPITERGANLIQGMSGSPIYLNGKVAGAFSMGEMWPKEPVGMVTPIEDMLDAWDPNIPQHPSYFQPADKKPVNPATEDKTGMRWQPDNRERVAVLPHPIVVGDRRISRLVLNARADDPRRSTPEMAVLHRATSLIAVTGIDARDRDWFQKELDKRGFALTVAQAPMVSGGKPEFKGTPLRPGSAFGTFLATGDVQVGGTGTVTYRRGDRMLGFGHPLMGLGAMEAAITSAYIIDIFSGVNVSHHWAIPGPVVGTLQQDRNFSVSGEIGPKPHLVPFDITVHDETENRSQTFHTGMFQHPELTPVLMRLIAQECISRVHGIPGDVMARVTTSVDAAEVGTVSRTNMVFDAEDISTAATADLNEITNIVSGNPFYPLPIKSAHMTVDITGGHNTATVERIFLKQGRYEPGDSLDIGVVLKPYRQDQITRTVSLKIPSDTPTGRYQLIVRGGTASVTRIGPFIISGGGAPDPQTPPVNVRQMVARLNEHEANTDVVARLVLNSVAPALEGEKLSQLPPNLSALMRSDRNSGVRLERDELRTSEHTDYVVSGTQQLIVTVVRKNTQEPSSGGGFGTPSIPGGLGNPATTIPGGGGLTGANANDEDTSQDSDPADGQAPHPAAAPDTTGTRSAPIESAEMQRWRMALMAAPPASGDKAPGKRKPGKNDADTNAKPASATPPPSTSATTPTPPAATADTSNDKPVGRQMQVWKQTARTDFAAGTFSGTGVTAGGDLRLTPTLHRLASSAETYIWSLAADPQGVLYAGTGTSGKILKIDPQGKVTTFATLPVVAVQCLLLAGDGTLWAGSGVKGNLYRVAPDGTSTLVRSFPEKYILALAQDSKGNLFVGPGGGGNVYRLTSEQQKTADTSDTKPVPYLKTGADHIMALETDAQDNLYVGTGSEGTLYKVTPDGKSSVLYDAKENSITALATSADGDVYVGTGPKGMIYRVNPDGIATVLYDRATTFFTGLKVAPDGTLYASSVNALYHLVPSATNPVEPVVVPLDNPKEVDFLTLALLPGGGVATGTGNIGEIYTSVPDANASHDGTYVSPVHDAKLLSRWGDLRWDATLPADSHLRVETRSGNVAEPDATWSAWSAVRQESGDSEGVITSPSARFIQYRLTLDAASPSGAQPVVHEVSVAYMTHNQPPTVAFTAPLGGERWAKSQTIRWSGSDPDNDTLTYELFYSGDSGLTWISVPAAAKPATGATPVATSPGTVGTPLPATPPGTGGTLPPPAMPTLEQLQKQLDSQPNMPDTFKKMVLENYRRRLAAAGGTESASALHETSKSWDTTTVTDGTYQLKVIASDHLSNPIDAQTAEAISDPFVICNTPPRIQIAVNQVIGPARSVAIEGSATQSLIEITAVQYRVDSGEWVAAAAKDGLFDTARASFAFVTGALAPGKHTIEVEVFNTAGNKATEKVNVDVP